MPFTVIKGTFNPSVGYPDRDSVRFAPNNPSPLFTLPRKGRSPRVNNSNGTVQLRYEGIDSMAKDAKEPFASDATKKNLELIRVNNINDETKGYILVNQIGPNGRPLCFVFADDTDLEDGKDDYYLDTEKIKESVNNKLLESGNAYPLFYDTLYRALRNVLAEATKNAKSNGAGVWPNDKTKSGVKCEGAASLPDLDPIFPKLWRRLEKYTQNRDFRDESHNLDAFIDFLKANRDRLIIISESRSNDLDNIVEVDGSNVKLTYNPEDIFFMS